MDPLDGRSVVIDRRIESYEGFLDDEFTRAAFTAADIFETLSPLIFNLVTDWRSISYAIAFPALAPSAIENFHHGMLGQGSIDYSTLGFLEYVLTRLQEKVPHLVNNHALQGDLRSELYGILGELRGLQASRDASINMYSIWQQYIRLHAFHLGLHGIMRVSYTGLFSAYEEFLVRCARVRSGCQRLRSTSRDFSRTLGDIFGSDMRDICWSSPQVAIVRTIRNKLVHAGGQVDESVQNMQHLVHVQDGFMHVFPGHVKQAYEQLRSPALALMSQAILN